MIDGHAKIELDFGNIVINEKGMALHLEKKLAKEHDLSIHHPIFLLEKNGVDITIATDSPKVEGEELLPFLSLISVFCTTADIYLIIEPAETKLLTNFFEIFLPEFGFAPFVTPKGRIMNRIFMVGLQDIEETTSMRNWIKNAVEPLTTSITSFRESKVKEFSNKTEELLVTSFNVNHFSNLYMRFRQNLASFFDNLLYSLDEMKESLFKIDAVLYSFQVKKLFQTLVEKFDIVEKEGKNVELRMKIKKKAKIRAADFVKALNKLLGIEE